MFIHSPLLGAIPGVVHAFSDDQGPWLSEPAQLEAFWAGLSRPLGFDSHSVARLHQVHGCDVVRVTEGGDGGDGDALICRDPGVLLAIRTADCVPVLLAAPGEVGAVHAGWRGLVAGVIEETVARLEASSLVAAIGPCIGVRHYEVGPEVVAAVRLCGVPESVFLREDLGPRPHVDLRAAAAWKLERLGVSVDHLPICTWEDARFPSYRRSGPLSGRMVSMVGLRC